MPEELKGEEALADESGRGITEDDLYGPLDEDGTTDQGHVDPDILAQTGQDEGGDAAAAEEEVVTGAEGDAAEAQAQAGTDAGGADDPPPPPPETKKTPNIWDHERQKRDQDHANEKRAMQDQLAQLNAQLEEAKRKPEENRTTETDEYDVAIKAIQKKLEAVDPDEDPDAARSLVDEVVKTDLLALLSKPRTSPEIRALQQKVESLEAEKKAEEQRRQESEAAKAAQGAQADYDAYIAELDAKYGDKLRDEATTRILNQLAAAGYKDGKLPDVFTAKAVAKAVYLELAAESPPRRREGNPPKKGKPPVPGSGRGAAVSSKAFHGDLESVARDMLKSGKFSK